MLNKVEGFFGKNVKMKNGVIESLSGKKPNENQSQPQIAKVREG